MSKVESKKLCDLYNEKCEVYRRKAIKGEDTAQAEREMDEVFEQIIELAKKESKGKVTEVNK